MVNKFLYIVLLALSLLWGAPNAVAFQLEGIDDHFDDSDGALQDFEEYGQQATETFAGAIPMVGAFVKPLLTHMNRGEGEGEAGTDEMLPIIFVMAIILLVFVIMRDLWQFMKYRLKRKLLLALASFVSAFIPYWNLIFAIIRIILIVIDLFRAGSRATQVR